MDNCLKSFKGKLFLLAFGIFSSSLALAEEGVTILSDGSAEVVTSTSRTTSGIQPLAGITVSSGGLVNSPGTGVGGADESVLQSISLSLDTLGFGHQLAINRIADDFTTTTTGTLNSVIFYAYQTGSTTTSTMTAVNLRIWDGPPAQPGSNIVFGDTTTNILASSEWSNVYRVNEDNTGTSTSRPIMANTVNVGVKLPAGTYWLDWQTGGSASFSGPFAPPISINGQTTTGNGLQSLDNGATYAAANDGVARTRQGFPFVLDISEPNLHECLSNVDFFGCFIEYTNDKRIPFCNTITENASGYSIETPFGLTVGTVNGTDADDLNEFIEDICFPLVPEAP